jgi:hypothetical protein
MSSAASSEDVTIFTGVFRSGTSYLGRLARSYLDVGAVNEGEFEFWLDGRVPDESRLLDDQFYHSLLRELASNEYFRLLYNQVNIAVDDLAQQFKDFIATRSLEGVAVGVLKHSAAHLGCSRFGHESPRLLKDLSRVQRILPHCRFVHIVRDPRAAATSILRFPWGANNVVVAAELWHDWVRSARLLALALGSKRYLEIRFEDLMLWPHETMQKLMEFVCGEVDGHKLEQFVEEVETNPRRSRSLGKWREEISPAQMEVIEAITCREMPYHGYQPETTKQGLSMASRLLGRAHHRVVQVKNILSGRLKLNGDAVLILRPEEEVYGIR